MSPAVAVCGWWELTTWSWSHTCKRSHGSKWSASIKKSNFKFSAYLKTWPQMIFDLDIWPLTLLTSEGSHVASISQDWFQSDFNFSNEAKLHIFSLSENKLRWSLTLICDLWPCQQVKILMLLQWLTFGSNWTFQMRPFFFYFEPILKWDLRRPLTLVCDLWPYQQRRVPMLHLWLNFGWNPSKHVEVTAKC